MLNRCKNFTYPSYFAYQQFNLYYLKHIFNINLTEKNINALHVLPKNLMHRVLFKTRHKHYKSYNIKYFNEVVYLFVVNI